MITTVFIVGVALILAILLRRRAHWAVGLYLVLWTLVPEAEMQSFGDSALPIGLHPASWLIISMFVIQLVSRPSAVAKAIRFHPAILSLFGIGVVMLVATIVGRGRLQIFSEEVGVPILALIIVLIAATEQRSIVKQLALLIVALAAVVSIGGIAEFISGRYLFYIEANQAAYAWYNANAFDRPMSTTGHALVFGFFAACSIPLLVVIRSARLQFGLAVVLYTGVLVSQTRLSLVIASVAVLYLILRADTAPTTRLFLSVLIGLGSLCVVFFAGSLSTFQRFSLDDSSAELRRISYGWYAENWSSLPVIGSGMGSFSAVAQASGLSTSFESSLIQLLIDFGIPIVTVLVATLVVLLLPRRGHRRLRGPLAASIAAVTLTLTFSSIGNVTLVGPVLFVLIGMAVVNSPLDDRGEDLLPSSSARASEPLVRVPVRESFST